MGAGWQKETPGSILGDRAGSRDRIDHATCVEEFDLGTSAYLWWRACGEDWIGSPVERDRVRLRRRDGGSDSPALYSGVQKGRQAPGILGSELGLIDPCEVVAVVSQPNSPNPVDAAIVFLVFLGQCPNPNSGVILCEWCFKNHKRGRPCGWLAKMTSPLGDLPF